MSMKFQKIFMTGCRDIDNKYQIASKIGLFSICYIQDFFQNWAVTFIPLWCANFMQKLEKSLERSLRYLKTDGPGTNGRTDKGDYQGPPRVNLGSKMKGD